MIVSIMQPAYIPWLGYFDRILKSDVHIVLDNVVMDKNSKTKFTNRNKVRTSNGWAWLTVPLQSTERSKENPIINLGISPDINWAEKHFKTIQLNYSRTPFYSRFFGFFEDFYSQNWKYLYPMLKESTEYFLQELDIRTECISSSDLSLESKKAELILDMCREVGATTYLSGPFGRNYLNQRDFEEVGIELQFHDYAHPVYMQNFDGFEPYMSIIDLLFNHGDKSLEILRS